MTNGQQNPQPDWNAVLEVLQKIADALENPPVHEQEGTEAVLATATSNIDYLALRQLMDQKRRDNEPDAIFPASCDRSRNHPVLQLTEVPPKTAKVAVFIDRGKPAQVVDTSKHEADYAADKNKKPIGYTLDQIDIKQAITRVEFRRTDNYPLGLGRRFPV